MHCIQVAGGTDAAAGSRSTSSNALSGQDRLIKQSTSTDVSLQQLHRHSFLGVQDNLNDSLSEESLALNRKDLEALRVQVLETIQGAPNPPQRSNRLLQSCCKPLAKHNLPSWPDPMFNMLF